MIKENKAMNYSKMHKEMKTIIIIIICLIKILFNLLRKNKFNK